MASAADGATDSRSDAPLLVGREREQAVLHESLAAARAGRGGVVLIGGEAGIGKTTLVDALKREAVADGVRVLSGGCYDLTTTPPYGPWIDLVNQSSIEPAGARLPAVLLRETAAGAVASQEALFDEARTFFANLAEDRPVMLVLEDLHWADAASLELLRFIARPARQSPLLLIVTYRVDEVPADHPLLPLLPLLARESAAERIDLRRLTEPDIGALVSRRYELAAGDFERLVAYLLAHTDGNSLYLNELLRTLQEERMLSESEAGWALGDLRTLVVPRLIRQVIAGRAARLDEATRNLLAIASVIGQEVALDVWASVSGVSDDALLVAVEQAVAANFLVAAESGLAVHFAHALTREALYDEILPIRRRVWHRRIAETLEQATRPSPDAVGHHFQAAGDTRAATWLIRAGESAERSYAWTTAAARFEAALPLLEADPAAQRLHGWVLLHLGRVLRFATPDRSVGFLDEALKLADEAGDRALASLARVHAGGVRCFRWDVQRGMAEARAGIAAQDTLTPAEWADAYRLQRALIDPLPAELDLDDPNGLEIAIVTSQQTGFLVHLLAHVAFPYQEVISMGEAYAARIDAIGEQALLRHTSTVEGASWIDTWFGLGEAYAVVGQVEAAERAFSRAVKLYRAAGHHAIVSGLATMHGWVVQLPYHADDHDARARWRAIGETSQEREEGAYSPGWSPGMSRLPLFVLEGAWSEAREVARNMTQHQPANLVMLAEAALVTVAHAQGDIETAWGIIQRRFPAGPSSDITATIAVHAFDLARLAAAMSLDSGDRTAAERWLTAHDGWMDATGRVLGRAEGQLLWARLHALVGDWEQAHAAAAAALELASQPRQPVALLAAQRLLGEFAMRENRLEQAGQRLAASLDLAVACGARFEQALTLLAIADLLVASRSTDEARQRAEEARLICESLGATPTLERAAALLTRLGAGAGAPAYPAGLTAREVEVLRQVAQGLTDAEVAEQLFLARRTVNTHLTSIYTKLGVSSRSAATRFAVENGLT